MTYSVVTFSNDGEDFFNLDARSGEIKIRRLLTGALFDPYEVCATVFHKVWGVCGQAMVPDNFQCQGVLLIWIIVG